VTSFNTRSGAVTLVAADISGAGGALLASPTFTGTPQAPTAAPGTSTQQLATTAFVTGALATQAANSVTSFNGRQGVVTLITADITGAGGAPIASPAFTGVPTVPTATAGTSTLQAASTAFVMNAIAASTAGVTSFNSRTGAVTLQANDVSAVGGALLASPVFTGTPSAPTPVPADNSTTLATTAFVRTALTNFGGAYLPLAGGASMTGLYNLSGNATANLNPVPLQQMNAALTAYAPINSPTFTGTVTTAALTANGAANFAATAQFGANLSMTGLNSQIQFQNGGNSGIRGETDGAAAAAGLVGELVTTAFGASATSSGAVAECGTMALGVGSWLVWSQCVFASQNGSDTLLYITTGVSTASNSFTPRVTLQATRSQSSTGPMTPTANTLETPHAVLNTTATTLHLIFQAFTTGGTGVSVSGQLFALRIR